MQGEAIRLIILLAAVNAGSFPIVSLASGNHSPEAKGYPDRDLPAIQAILEDYETSIRSYSIRYRVERQLTPAAWKAKRQALRSKASVKTSDSPSPDASDQLPKPEVIRWELVVSDEKVWRKVPLGQTDDAGFEVLVFDGKHTSQLTLNALGEMKAGAQNVDQQTIRVDKLSPVHLAGLYFGPVVKGRHTRLDAMRAGIESWKRIEGRSVCIVKNDPGATNKTVDYLYLDSEHDFLPLRIDTITLEGKKLYSLQVTRFAQFRDESSGRSVWFPVEYEHELYGRYSPNELDMISHVIVEDFSINPRISPEQFSVAMPQGVPITDAETHETKVISTPAKRAEMAQKAALQGRESLAKALVTAHQTNPAVRAGKPSTTAWFAISIGCIGVVFLLCGLWLRFGR